MENKTFTHIQNSSSITNHSSKSDTLLTNAPNLFVLPSAINPSIIATSSLPTLQSIPVTRSVQLYSDNNNGSNIVITQPTFKKLLGETVKQEQVEEDPIKQEYSIEKDKIITHQSKLHQTQSPTVTSINLNPREIANCLSNTPMAMSNVGAHIISALNPAHLPDATGTYFVSGLSNDLTSNYKLIASTSSNVLSPSNSSNSSNPSSSNHQQTRRHGEGGDTTRKREMRLQKNRDAARECRRKKKEYIKCLEERVTGLENQNKALIEELRQLKELYCQHGETNTNDKATSTIH